MPSELTLLAIAGLLLAPGLQAQNLTIPGHVKSDQQQIMPRRGIDMNAVIVEFG